MPTIKVEREYKHIHFTKEEEGWACRNNRSSEQLGVVKWYAPWRQYCYHPTIQAVYSQSCLDDISDFLEHVNNQPPF
jgi:hypothetical protein